MNMYLRFTLALVLAALFVSGKPAPAPAQISFSFGGDSDDDHDRHGDHRRGDNHRHRDRDDDDHGIRFGGSDAEKVQQILDGGQSKSGKHHKSSRQEFESKSKRRHFDSDSNRHRHHDHGHHDHGHYDGDNWIIEFGGATPFSAPWYDDHPNAWRHHHHHHHDHDDDAWKIATAAGVLGWLGWGGTVQGGPVVVYDAPVVDPNAPSEWMTLGAYSLRTGPGDAGTRMLELAVDRHGLVGGNYYDMITGTSSNVTGRIDRKTQRVTWSIDSNRQLTFSASLNQLTQGEGLVDVKFPSGRTQQWRLVRMEDFDR
jgi:hypothetical protein